MPGSTERTYAVSGLGVVNLEVVVFVPAFTPLCGHVGHVSAGRTLVQPPDELLEFLPFALGCDINAPVGQIPYDPAQTEFSCLADNERPEENTLDDTGDHSVKRCFIGPFGHG